MNFCKSLIILLLLSFASSLNAQIYFRNNTNEPIYVTVATYIGSKNFKSWTSDGWWYIEPHQKKKVSNIRANSSSLNLYYYAYTSDKKYVYEGHQPFLVDPINNFTLQNADMKYQEKEHPFYVWYNFRKIHIDAQVISPEYTFDLYD